MLFIENGQEWRASIEAMTEDEYEWYDWVGREKRGKRGEKWSDAMYVRSSRGEGLRLQEAILDA